MYGRALIEVYLTYRPDKIRQTVSGKSNVIAISVRLGELLAAAVDRTRQVMSEYGLKEWRAGRDPY